MLGIFKLKCWFDWVMVDIVWGGVWDVDVIVFLIDVCKGIDEEVESIFK